MFSRYYHQQLEHQKRNIIFIGTFDKSIFLQETNQNSEHTQTMNDAGNDRIVFSSKAHFYAARLPNTDFNTDNHKMKHHKGNNRPSAIWIRAFRGPYNKYK